MEIVNKKIEELKPYENNPRFNDEAVEYVKNSIKEFGFKVPMIIDKNNTIITGHTRYKAAKMIGLKEVPVIIADDLTEEQIKAFRLVDNKTAEIAEWDFELLQDEIDDILNIDLSRFGFENELDDDDIDPEEVETPLPPEEPKSKLGEIYKLGNHRLMVGDSTNPNDVRELMGGVEADLVVTDPPYNVNIQNSQGMQIENDNMGDIQFKEFLIKAFENLKDSLKPGGPFYIWYASREHINFESALNEADLWVRQQLIWVKNTFILGRSDYHWKHEPCLYGWKDGDGHYFIDDRTQSTVIDDQVDFNKLKKEEAIEMLKQIYESGIETTVIREDKPTKNDLHPTMKPIKLIARLIKNSSRRDESVLDLFAGSGSTLIACEQLGRKSYNMEYDPRYADVIIERWENYTGKKAEKVKG